MEHKRLFISIPIDPSLAKGLLRHVENLNIPLQNLRLVKAENMHINLKFLGDTTLDKLDDIIKTVTEVCRNFGGLSLEINQTKIFPVTEDQKRPARILNVSFKYNEKLQELYDKIEDALWQAGLAHKETRRFTPNVTMAIVKKSTAISEFKDFIDLPVSGDLPIDYVELQESILEKTGPSYFVLSTFDL